MGDKGQRLNGSAFCCRKAHAGQEQGEHHVESPEGRAVENAECECPAACRIAPHLLIGTCALEKLLNGSLLFFLGRNCNGLAALDSIVDDGNTVLGLKVFVKQSDEKEYNTAADEHHQACTLVPLEACVGHCEYIGGNAGQCNAEEHRLKAVCKCTLALGPPHSLNGHVDGLNDAEADPLDNADQADKRKALRPKQIQDAGEHLKAEADESCALVADLHCKRADKEGCNRQRYGRGGGHYRELCLADAGGVHELCAHRSNALRAGVQEYVRKKVHHEHQISVRRCFFELYDACFRIHFSSPNLNFFGTALYMGFNRTKLRAL